MFQNERYVTRGIANQVQRDLQLILWAMIDLNEQEKDYLQVFEVTCVMGKTVVTHTQEQPEYRKVFTFSLDLHFVGKIYIIDDGDHSTMMLAEEY